jgi:hypothetical protein
MPRDGATTSIYITQRAIWPNLSEEQLRQLL